MGWGLGEGGDVRVTVEGGGEGGVVGCHGCGEEVVNVEGNKV